MLSRDPQPGFALFRAFPELATEMETCAVEPGLVCVLKFWRWLSTCEWGEFEWRGDVATIRVPAAACRLGAGRGVALGASLRHGRNLFRVFHVKHFMERLSNWAGPAPVRSAQDQYFREAMLTRWPKSRGGCHWAPVSVAS